MAIADGFEVWIKHVDDQFALNNPERRAADIDPVQLFRAYENGTPSATFAADPDAPLVPPKRWRARMNRPATVARIPYWPMIGVLVAAISIYLIRGVGMEAMRDFLTLDAQRTQIFQVERGSTLGSQYRKTLGSRRESIEHREAQALYTGLMYTYLPTMVLWYTVCLMLMSNMLVYMRLNYWPVKRLNDSMRRMRFASKEQTFPDN